MTTNTPHLSGSHNRHARLAPSNSKSWSSCTAGPAFLLANSHRIRKDNDTVYSSEGTVCHDWATKYLLREITLEDVPEFFRPHVDNYAKHCISLIPEGGKYLVERQVDLFYQPDKTGTLDFGFVSDDLVVIADLKFGAGVLVPAESNTQLLTYALSMVREWEGVFAFHPATEVRMSIYQPRHREAGDAKPWVLTLSELEILGKDLELRSIQAFTAIERVQKKLPCGERDISPEEILEAAPMVKFQPGEGDEGACRFCPARAICSKRLEAITEDCTSPQLDFTDLIADMPDLSKADAKLPVDERVEARVPGILDDAYLVKVFKASKNIGKWLDDVAEYLETRVMAGEKVPGLKLVMGREGNRAWTDEDAADKLLAQSGKLKMEERYKMSLISPTQAEEKLAEKIEKSTRFRNCFQALVGRSPAKPVLALESDKREAVNSPVDDMPDVDDDLGEL